MPDTKRLAKAALYLAPVALCLAAFWQAGAQTTALVRYPYLQNVRADRATIMWATAENGSGAVQYSTDRSFSGTIMAFPRRFPAAETRMSAEYFQHQADLTGLSPNTNYFYRVLLGERVLTFDDELRFRTEGPGPFSFLAFGDSGWGSREQRDLRDVMLRERPALVLHTGDIAYLNGTFDQFHRRHFDVYQQLMKRAPFFPSPGNHEYETDNAAPYLALHAPPTEDVPFADRGRYYSFDWGNVHFVALDTNAPLASAVRGSGRMLEWLESDLKKTNRLWKVVYFHHAAYPTSNHEFDPTGAVVRERVAPILERYDVQLVLSGHEHNYQQSFPLRDGRIVEPGAGTVHVITGGGGAPLYSVAPRPRLAFARSTYHYVRGAVQGRSLTLSAIDINGEVIDNFTLTAPPLITVESIVNAASFTPALAPGALVSIFGLQLAAGESQATSLPLPLELAGTSVRLAGRRLPLLYVATHQINAQLHFDVQGPATLQVITPGGSVEVPVMITEPAPAIFSSSADPNGSPAVVRANGALVSAASPALAGELVSVYLTGLGRPNGEILAGQPAPFSPLLTVRGPVEAQVGVVSVTPSFTGLAPGFVGLYQVNLQIPQELPTGMHALRIVVRGVSSNTVSLAVRSR